MRRYGVDLGTTNTCVYCAFIEPAILKMGYKEAGWKFERVNIRYKDTGSITNVPDTMSMPSAIYAKTEENGRYRYYIGEIAKRMAMIDDEPDLINTKRLFCRETPEQIIAYGLSAQDVAQKLLEGCWHSIFMQAWDGNETKKKAVESMLERSDTIFCVTQPAAFNIFASIAIEDAARKAGFKNIDAQKEPTAALLSFLYDELRDGDKRAQKMLTRQKKNGKLLVLVVDIGGGTTDVTIQEIEIAGDYEAGDNDTTYTGYEIRFANQTKAAANQEPAFGGMDFDNVILRHLAGRIAEVYKKEANGEELDWTGMRGMRDKSDLYEQGQNYKNKLSALGGRSAPDQEFYIRNRTIRCSASAKEIYDWCEELCESPVGSDGSNRTVYGIILDTIKRSGYNANDIDYVYVTGGMSRFLPIREMLGRNFSALAAEGNVVFSENPLEDIARGAALCNTFFKVKMPQKVLHSDLMIDDPCGEPKIIVPKQTPLPVENTLENFMELRNPTSVYVDILYGNGTRESSLRKIKRVRRMLDPVMPIGTPISIKYKVDEKQAVDIILTLHDSQNGDRQIELLKLIDRK